MIRIRRLFLLGAIALGVTTARAEMVYVTTSQGKLFSINSATGSLSTFGPTVDGAYGLAVDKMGDVYVGSNGFSGTTIVELSPAGNLVPTSFGSTYVSTEGLAVDSRGNVFAGDFTYPGVLEFARSGAITNFGDSSPYAPRTRLRQPRQSLRGGRQ